MEEKCECNYFGKKLSDLPEIIKTFKLVGMSGSKDGARYGEGEFTAIVKCKKCNSYYIFDSYKDELIGEDSVSVRKYIPKIKVDDKGLEKILKLFEGIVDEQDIENYFGYLEKLRKIELKKNYSFNIDAHKN